MAWSVISLVSTGELATASVQNTQVLGNLNELRTGGIAIASQAALDLLYATSTTQLGRIPALTALQVLRMNAGATAYEGALQQATLLRAASGSDATAAATTVDTYAMTSSLTALDTLVVMVEVEGVTQQTANPVQLYNVTDSVTILDLLGGNVLAAGKVAHISPVKIRQSQTSNLKVNAALGGVTIVGVINGVGQGLQSTFTTAWTGAWTLGLRHGGVTAGGSFKWSWAMFVLKGQ